MTGRSEGGADDEDYCFHGDFVAFDHRVGAGQEMPKPAPEHKRLVYFVGTWNFAGEAKAGPMGPAGAVTFKEVCEMMDGGFALVCRTEGKSPMGPTKGVSIMSYDTEKKTYTYTAAEAGCRPSRRSARRPARRGPGPPSRRWPASR